MILLHRLSDSFGLGGKVIKWLTSYLAEQSQTVKIGATLSEKQLLKYGVLQGSVLGPLLIIIHHTCIPLPSVKKNSREFQALTALSLC
jgi:hypothetical protein